MTLSNKCVTAASLMAFFGCVSLSSGATCSNRSVSGVYNAQISSANINALLNGSNGSQGKTATQAGFGSNPNSIVGQTPALGRFIFDGNGNILGVSSTASNGTQTIGTYSVAEDCTGTMQLKSGETFDAVVARNGGEVLFIESDSKGAGAVGSLRRTAAVCSGVIVPYFSGEPANAFRRFAFSAFGAQAPASSGSTGSTGTTGSTGSTGATDTARPYSAVGSLTLTAAQTFTITEWVTQDGKVQQVTGSGTYSAARNCSLTFTFAKGSDAALPASFTGLVVDAEGGFVTLQPTKDSFVTGQLVAQ